MLMKYLGKTVSKDMVRPVLNGHDYDVNIVKAPFRNQDGELRTRLVIFVHDLEDDKCIAALTYRENEWTENINKTKHFRTKTIERE